MIVMPSNASGWFWHALARETGRLGHLYSPGGERGPWPWFPYALDNGAFSFWQQDDNEFDHDAWMRVGELAWQRLIVWSQACGTRPLWSIVPDVPGDAEHDMLDHRHLNEVEGLENPTTEVLAPFIARALIDALPLLFAVRVYESSTTWCEVLRGDLA